MNNSLFQNQTKSFDQNNQPKIISQKTRPKTSTIRKIVFDVGQPQKLENPSLQKDNAHRQKLNYFYGPYEKLNNIAQNSSSLQKLEALKQNEKLNQQNLNASVSLKIDVSKSDLNNMTNFSQSPKLVHQRSSSPQKQQTLKKQVKEVYVDEEKLYSELQEYIEKNKQKQEFMSFDFDNSESQSQSKKLTWLNIAKTILSPSKQTFQGLIDKLQKRKLYEGFLEKQMKKRKRKFQQTSFQNNLLSGGMSREGSYNQQIERGQPIREMSKNTEIQGWQQSNNNDLREDSITINSNSSSNLSLEIEDLESVKIDRLGVPGQDRKDKKRGSKSNRKKSIKPIGNSGSNSKSRRNTQFAQVKSPNGNKSQIKSPKTNRISTIVSSPTQQQNQDTQFEQEHKQVSEFQINKDLQSQNTFSDQIQENNFIAYKIITTKIETHSNQKFLKQLINLNFAK
eukprot:403374550